MLIVLRALILTRSLACSSSSPSQTGLISLAFGLQMYSYIYASIYVLQVRSQKDSMERALRSEVESLKEKLQSEGYGLSSTATDTAQSNLMIETVRMESISNTLTCDSRVLTYDTLCCALLP